MAINKNHEFEELNGIKCAIVEKNVQSARAAFLEELLTYNGYTVVIAATPPPKASLPAEAEPGAVPEPPETFTVGVTDVMFNPTNAIFGRALKTRSGRVVTLAYYHQREPVSHDDVPYFDNGK